MPERAPVYRYAGPKRPRVAPFPGVPARDLTAEDVARLPLATVKAMTAGARPLYQKVGRTPPPAATETPAVKAAKAEAPAEKEG